MKNSFVILKSFFIFILTILLTSCDRPTCKNTNPIFDRYTPESKEYKRELAKQIELIGTENLGFWIKDYDWDKHYLLLNIQNETLCAEGYIEVADWSKISRIQKKGEGPNRIYAELTGLEIDIIKDSTTTRFIFKDYDWLID